MRLVRTMPSFVMETVATAANHSHLDAHECVDSEPLMQLLRHARVFTSDPSDGEFETDITGFIAHLAMLVGGITQLRDYPLEDILDAVRFFYDTVKEEHVQTNAPGARTGCQPS
jgi:hypothetical protein